MEAWLAHAIVSITHDSACMVRVTNYLRAGSQCLGSWQWRWASSSDGQLVSMQRQQQLEGNYLGRLTAAG